MRSFSGEFLDTPADTAVVGPGAASASLLFEVETPTLIASNAYRVPDARRVWQTSVRARVAPIGGPFTLTVRVNGVVEVTVTLADGENSATDETVVQLQAGDLVSVRATALGGGGLAQGVLAQLDWD